MKNGWIQKNADWWWCDFSAIEETGKLKPRPLPGYWQTAPYETTEFSGTMILANPSQAAPEIRVPLPVSGRHSIALGLLVNLCDKVLLKIDGDPCFRSLAHSPVSPGADSIEECWWRDIDLKKGDVLVIKQDNAMKRRIAVAFIHLYPALPATRPEIPFYTTADGLPGNNGPLSLDEMLQEELQFEDTHITDILHGTDINGAAQYMTKMPSHRHPTQLAAEEKQPDNEYYLWTIQQLQRYEKEGRCPLRDSIEAAHRIGRGFYAYYRMAVTRLYAPYRTLFENPMFDAHSEWRCVDFDGTPISRLSIAFPEVRRYMLDHFRENVEFGADGVCLVFCRGWPLVLFEKPVADEFAKRTGKDLHSVKPDDPDLRQVRADFITGFMRDIRRTVTEAGKGRKTGVVALTLASPAINRHYGMDVDLWAREELVQVFCPYPLGITYTPTPIPIPDWTAALRGTKAQLCPILNRQTYEPAGRFDTPQVLLDRAEQWLKEGVDGFSIWDLDGFLRLPTFRGLGYNLASAEGRKRLRSQISKGPVHHKLKTLDGLTVDRYHPGWNV